MSQAIISKSVINMHVPAINDVYIQGNISLGGTANLNDVAVTGNLTISNDVAIIGKLAVADDIYAYSDLQIQGNIVPFNNTNLVIDGNVTIDGTTTSTGDLNLSANLVPSTSTYVKGNLKVTKDTFVSGNSHTTGYNSAQMVGFKVHRTGNFNFSTSTSIFENCTIGGNVFNSYDNNPFSYNGSGWKSNTGLYQIPVAGYYKIEITVRAQDSETTIGFKPVLFDTEVYYMIEDSDHTIWIPEDNSTRRMATYDTCIYCNAGDWLYALPHSTNYWKYVEFSGRWVGTS